MERINLNQVLNGYAERIRRLALFEPLEDLQRKKSTDKHGKSIDMKGLGLLALLFFFEQKLMRAHKTSIHELSYFLAQSTVETYEYKDKQLNDLARQILYTFRPQSGLKRSAMFFNWETKREETLTFSFITNHSFDVKTNTQYYTLDDDGLELVFATKEFYSEFQLSINQLVLRKQLEKGEFSGALRQINEMLVDVETLSERMIRVEHELKRNIISEETFERYKKLLDDSSTRLKHENEEFDELEQFVKETKGRLYYKDIEDKERKTYELILKIERELGNVHQDHTKLLTQSFHLKHTALKSAQESLYSMGLEMFNFEQEIVSRVVSSPLPPETMKAFVAPFLRGGEQKQWSLLTILEPQSISEERDDVTQAGFLSSDDDDEKDRHLQYVREKFQQYFSIMLTALGTDRATTLSKVISSVREKEPSFLDERLFYDFWIILHQHSPLVATGTGDDEGTAMQEVQQMLISGVLHIAEIPGDILHTNDRFTIQNLTFTWEENKHERQA
ncbi:replicative DNA helicase [Salipaludibacillus sp. HK11]|uniref:replicative DNA helicase n=1 Tax=Salipaludibacillus sp. HK11 TaxID=3394320 RepID=UPI0039FCD7FF